MSRDVITVGSTMRILLLYRGEYSQWRERFMNHLEEQTDGGAMINSIHNGDQPLPVIAQVSLVGNAQNAPPTLKDPNNKTAKYLWDALERQMCGSEYGEQDRKAVILYEYETFKANEGEQLLDTYLRYLQVINDLKKCGYKKDTCELNYKFLNNLQPGWKQYGTLIRQTKNLMDINIDALYNILKQNQGDVNDALGYKKKVVVVTSDPLALVAEKTNVSKQKEKVVVSSDSEGSGEDDFRHFAKDCKKAKVKDYNYYKTKMLLAKKDGDEQVLFAEDQAWMESSSDSDQKINANMVFMSQIEKVLFDSKASSSSAGEKISEVSYYLSESKTESEFETSEYYDNSTNYGLFMNNDDDQEIFHDAIESASENFNENLIVSQKDYDKSEVDHNDSEEKEHLVDKLIRKFNHKIAKSNYIEFNEQIKVLNEKNADLLTQTKVLQDQLKLKHVVIDTHVECHEKYTKLEAERYEYMIRYSALCDNDKKHRKQIADQEVLFDKMSVQLVELDKHVRDLKNTILEKYLKISELEECVRNKDLEIEKCLERLNVYENKIHKMGQTNQAVHMIMPSKDILYNGRKEIGFENSRYFEKAKDLRLSLYDEKVIGLRYTPMFLTHSDEALEIEKFKRSRENKIEFAYDYGNLNASYQTSSLKLYVPNVILEKIIIDLEDEVVNLLEKEKANLETIESLKSKGFESSETAIFESKNQSENDCFDVEKECDKVENPKVIALGMFKLNVSQSVSPISMSKSSCDSKNIEIKLKRKRRKSKSSKQNDKQVNNNVLHAITDFVHFSDLDTSSSVRRPSHNGIIWKKKGSSNTSNDEMSSVSHLKLNKDVKRYSRKDLLSCNNSHLRETSSAFACNDAMNASCNFRICDLLDDNNFFIFDDESVRISPVSKMHFRKKPCDSMIVRSKSKLNKSLPRTVHKWLPKFQPLAEPVAKWFPKIVQICLWIIDSGCSKHMTGNRALLTNFVEKFLGTVRFGNNDFAVIAGYGDVVIGSITIKKVYYVEGLGHN
nr:integrase, catalytic region, zinc finger, CCHC-type, peptidase aspartic, catalytic [Tanacetum cinerariifolium]